MFTYNIKYVMYMYTHKNISSDFNKPEKEIITILWFPKKN